MNITEISGHLLKDYTPRPGTNLALLDGPHIQCIQCGRTWLKPTLKPEENIGFGEFDQCEPGAHAKRMFFDDERKKPFGFDFHAKTVEQAIDILKEHTIWHVSLDHDLCEVHYAWQSKENEGKPWPRKNMPPTGFAVLEWMHENDAWVPLILVHSLSTGAQDMMDFIRKNAPDWVTARRVKPKEI